MMKAEGLRCRICWAGGEGDPCARCRYVRPAFRAAGSVFVYDAEVLPAYRHDGAVRASVHALKYRGVSALAREMGGAMAAALEAWAPPVEAIVPVPLSGMRQRMRGYNQSALLAREVGRHAGLPVEGRAIVRRRQTPPQVHQPATTNG
jgi:competence protein ComFC